MVFIFYTVKARATQANGNREVVTGKMLGEIFIHSRQCEFIFRAITNCKKYLSKATYIFNSILYMKVNRKNFLVHSALAVAALTGLSSFYNKPKKQKMKNIFIHHVFFWLKHADNSADQLKLIEGLTKLSAVKTIQQFHIGKPANTNRDVIERGYAISWYVQFNNAADQASYQTDPIHLKFIEAYSHLWEKVIVYDSVDV